MCGMREGVQGGGGAWDGPALEEFKHFHLRPAGRCVTAASNSSGGWGLWGTVGAPRGLRSVAVMGAAWGTVHWVGTSGSGDSSGWGGVSTVVGGVVVLLSWG
jgi:hypothetical protein